MLQKPLTPFPDGSFKLLALMRVSHSTYYNTSMQFTLISALALITLGTMAFAAQAAASDKNGLHLDAEGA